MLPDWSPEVYWDAATTQLLNQFKPEIVRQRSVQEIIDKSEEFPIQFPTKTNKCKFIRSVVNEDVLNENINSVYPVMHESVLQLCCAFILFKRRCGNSIEQSYYRNVTLKDLINKLLNKRAVVFVYSGEFDKYLLLNGKSGIRSWETVGTREESPPLTIKECLSYDEIKLSALLYVSSHTYFVNKGQRTNIGKYEEKRNLVEDNGVIIGMIGTRLEKSNVMEYQEIIIGNRQNTEENGFGTAVEHSTPKLFATFYGEECLSYKEGQAKKKKDKIGRYTTIFGNILFDNHLYYKRLTLMIDTLLIEANSRARAKSTSAYVHVVGLGLGVWKISDHQNKLYMDSFAKRILHLGDKLNNVSDICFAYIGEEKLADYEDGQKFPLKNHPSGGINIHIYKREPHAKLEDDDEGKLLVVSYAWDGNALPGNEYWFGSLAGSGDPAAACSTQVSELHNPHINPLVSADNLRIVTKDGIVSIGDYQNKINESSIPNFDQLLSASSQPRSQSAKGRRAKQ